MSLVLITPTGARADAFSLCQEWMLRQTYKGDVKWIVSDDYIAPTTNDMNVNPNWELKILRPKPYWEKGQNTQSRNMLALLEHVSYDDKVIVIEDDDWYAPEYLEVVDKWLDSYDLVGEGKARYFNIQTGAYHDCGNTEHASLCATAVTRGAIEALRASCSKNIKFIDMDLWKTYEGSKAIYFTEMTVGIKGLPGRAGIGAGHRMKKPPQYTKLQEMIGEDYRLYENFNDNLLYDYNPFR